MNEINKENAENQSEKTDLMGQIPQESDKNYQVDLEEGAGGAGKS